MAIVVTGTGPVTLTLDSDTATDFTSNSTSPYTGLARGHEFLASIEATIGSGQNLTGEGLQLTAGGSGHTISVVNDGSIDNSNGSFSVAALVLISGDAGDLTYSGTGSVSGYSGIYATTFSSSTGLISIEVSDDGSGSERINTSVGSGISALSLGTGAVSIMGSGSISAEDYGIFASNQNVSPAMNAGIAITGSGRITSGSTGIVAEISGSGNAGDIVIARTGDIVAGYHGISASTAGTGNITIGEDATLIGDITAAGTAIRAAQTQASSGDISIRTGEGTIQTGDITAISATKAGGSGSVSIANAADLSHLFGPNGGWAAIDVLTGATGGIDITHSGSIAGTFGTGIQARTTGTAGGLEIISTGTIGTAGDRIDMEGIYARVNNADNAGSITIDADGGIHADAGIVALTNGLGSISIDGDGAIVAAGGHGIEAWQTGNAPGTNAGITIAGSGNVTSSGAVGILASISGAGNAGDILITRTGGVTAGGVGIDASTAGTGNIIIGTEAEPTGSITAGDHAVRAQQSGAGSISIRAAGGATLVSGDDASAILAELTNGGSGLVSIVNGADLDHAPGADGGTAIRAQSDGTGGITITHAGNVSGSFEDGVLARNDGSAGDVSVTVTGAIGADGEAVGLTGVTAMLTDVTSMGDIEVDISGDVFAAWSGVEAMTFGLGTVTVTVGGSVVGDTFGVNTYSTGHTGIEVSGSVGSSYIGIHAGGHGSKSIAIGEGGLVSGTGLAAILVSGSGSTDVTIAGHVAGSQATAAIWLDNDGDNLVDLTTSGSIDGFIVGTSNNDVFRLSGTGSATFDTSQLFGFSLLEKTGSSTWTLVGTMFGAPIDLLGGTLVVAEEDAACMGPITFGAGAQTLRLLAAETDDGEFANEIRDFGAGDLIDLDGFAFSTAMTVVFDMDWLDLDNGGQSFAIEFDTSAIPLRLSNNGTGGTLIATSDMGTTGADIMLGTAGNDRLDGRGGGDVMRAGAGNDVYLVRHAADKVFEAVGEGDDQVATNVSYALMAGQEIEKLTTFGSASTGNIDLTGNGFAQTIVGNAGNNRIDGRGGGDTMHGMAGDDLYLVRDAGDRVFEAAAGGNDQVATNVSYALMAGQEIEKLTTFGSASTGDINLTGNAFAQAFVGNAGANRIDGRGGGDRMYGMAGDDIYIVRDANDLVYEAGGGGNDQVITAVSWVMTAGQEIEKLTTFGSATTDHLNLTGNEFGQAIVGNAGNNVINGKGGSDRLFGMAGADTFVFDTALGPTNIDYIGDFTVAEDIIRLDRKVFTALAAGNLDASAFTTGTAATTAAHKIIYNAATGALLYDADGAGGAAAIRFATLTAGLSLTSADFSIV